MLCGVENIFCVHTTNNEDVWSTKYVWVHKNNEDVLCGVHTTNNEYVLCVVESIQLIMKMFCVE